MSTQNPGQSPSYEQYLEQFGLPDTRPTPGVSPGTNRDYITPIPQIVQPAPQTQNHSAGTGYNSNANSAQEALKALSQSNGTQEAFTVPQQVTPDLSDDATNIITLKLDGESLKVLMDANEIFRETIVNLGIKLVSEIPVYRTYFKKESLRLTSGNVGATTDSSVSGSSNMSASVSTSVSRPVEVLIPGEVSSGTPVKKKAAGFGTW